MEIKVLAFGITHEIIGERQFTLKLQEESKVSDLRSHLNQKFPRLQSLKSLAIACNETYAEDNEDLREGYVVALIPPVSGG